MANKEANIILEVVDLKMYFPIYRGILQRHVGNVKAVDGVSLFLREREVLGLVGESGCGKTTVGRTILRLYDPTSGEIRFRSKTGLPLATYFSGPKIKWLLDEVPGLKARGCCFTSSVHSPSSPYSMLTGTPCSSPAMLVSRALATEKCLTVQRAEANSAAMRRAKPTLHTLLHTAN